jgi:hypothetical protein
MPGFLRFRGEIMARGARQTALNNANSGYQGSQALNTQLENQNSQLQNWLVPQYQNLVQNPGYDQATKNAITLNSTGAAAAGFSGASDAAARSAARTGNSAALAPQQDQLAQQKAQTMAGVNAANQTNFANAARSDVQQGLSGLSGIYGQDQQLLAKALGIPPEYLGAYNQNVNSPWTGILDNAIKGAATGAAAGA